MSMEQTLLAYARPHMLAEKARALVRGEASKGCLPQIAPEPVFLEPPYQPMLAARDSAAFGPPRAWTSQPSVCEGDYVRFQVWISPDQACDWKRSERFLKQLASILHHVGLEVAGNQGCISIQILCHIADVPVIRNAFLAEFERCELSPAPFNLGCDSKAWSTIAFQDYYPAPPYSHLLTRPDELHTTLYGPVIQALSTIPAPGLGIYQAVFAPVAATHDWHRNVQALQDIEYAIKGLPGSMPVSQRYAQQVPSGALTQMSMDVETKAHSDKPFYAVALRLAVLGIENAQDHLTSLATFQNLIQHGGRPLSYLREGEYTTTLGPDCFRDIFTLGLAYRPGFLVNSWELTSLVHVPTIKLAAPRNLPITALETLPSSASLSFGTRIGTCSYAGRELPVCIPPGIRGQHVHLIGRSGMGKSTALEPMILDDIENGHGVAVLDPHGDLVERLLGLIPRQHADRVIYANPGDPEHVLTWNPLTRPLDEFMDPGRVADDIVSAFKSFVEGWGDRLEHLLRHAIESVIRLPQGTLLDASNVLRRKSQEGDTLRRRVQEVTDNQISRRFWRDDFYGYTNADLSPPQHKLSKLLGSGPISLMLSQPHSAFQFREIMDEGKVLLVNLTNMGAETRSILGCFMLSLLHLTALGRSSQPRDQRRPFHIYCDEAHRFVTDALEDLIAETRKYNVSLTLAHQYMTQFEKRKVDALSAVGSTIIFNVDSQDAQHLRKDLRGMVEAQDLIGLKEFQAIARIGTEVVRIRTLPPRQVPEDNCRDQIIAASIKRYYRPASEVRRMLNQRNGTPDERFVAVVADPGATPEEFGYEEF